MSQLAAVVNSRAGGGRAGKVWNELLRSVPELGAARLVQAPDVEGTRRELVRLIEEGVDRVVVLGGDGSMHVVGNILLDLGRGGDVAIGMVPLGTGSDLPRALNLPADARECARRVVHAAPRPIDVLELTTTDGRRRFVLNVASAGISGLVDEAVNRIPNRGATAYLRATVEAFFRYRPASCRVHVDGELWHDGDIFLFAMANGTSFGRGMHVAPRARVDDGEIDLILVEPAPRWQLLLRLGRIYRGSHLETRFVRWRRGRVIDIETSPTLPPFDVDGEVFPSASCRIRVLPGALRVLA